MPFDSVRNDMMKELEEVKALKAALIKKEIVTQTEINAEVKK